MSFPYPIEISLLLEVIWGTLLGLGPFCGITAAQAIYSLCRWFRDSEKRERTSVWWTLRRTIRKYGLYPILGGMGGLLGGVAWWFTAKWLYQGSSTLMMTGFWTAIYISAILLMPFIIRQSTEKLSAYVILLTLMLLPVTSFLTIKWFHIAPDQADIDMSVGLSLRISLIVGAVLIVPTAEHQKKPKYWAVGEQVSLLVQTITREKRWLMKKGVLIELAEELAYSPGTIRKFYSGERRPSAEATKKMLKIGKEFGLDQEWGQYLLKATNHFSDNQIVSVLDDIFG
jgi:hypothetical protein